MQRSTARVDYFSKWMGRKGARTSVQIHDHVDVLIVFEHLMVSHCEWHPAVFRQPVPAARHEPPWAPPCTFVRTNGRSAALARCTLPLARGIRWRTYLVELHHIRMLEQRHRADLAVDPRHARHVAALDDLARTPLVRLPVQAAFDDPRRALRRPRRLQWISRDYDGFLPFVAASGGEQEGGCLAEILHHAVVADDLMTLVPVARGYSGV